MSDPDLLTNLPQAIVAADKRLQPFVRRTRLAPAPYLSESAGADVYVKLESEQETGSFKLRGALNKLLTLAPDVRARGCVAASTGNHGAAVAHGGRLLGAPVIVFVPETAATGKLTTIRRIGAEIRAHGRDGVEAERAARAFAAAAGLVYISPYNDADVIAGQGTIAVEIVRELPQVDAIFVAVGGGGLAGGIGAYLRSVAPAAAIIGCSPRNSAVMAASVAAGEILALPSEPTLSDGTAGGVESGAVTLGLCQALLDRFVLVDEAAIATAMRRYIENQRALLEGAAGVALAAFESEAARWRGRRVVVIICGANIGLDTLRVVVNG